MNAERRKLIAKAIEALNLACELIEEAQSGEQEAFDNMPEGLQQSDRGQTVGQNAETLQQAYDDADNVRCLLEDIE